MSDFFGEILKGTAALMAPVIAALIILILNRLFKIVGLKVVEIQDGRFKQIVLDKIMATDEVARRVQLSSAEKNAKTVNDVIVAATDDPTLPNPSMEKVAAVVDAELGKARAGYMPDPGRPGLGRI